MNFADTAVYGKSGLSLPFSFGPVSVSTELETVAEVVMYGSGNVMGICFENKLPPGRSSMRETELDYPDEALGYGVSSSVAGLSSISSTQLEFIMHPSQSDWIRLATFTLNSPPTTIYPLLAISSTATQPWTDVEIGAPGLLSWVLLNVNGIYAVRVRMKTAANWGIIYTHGAVSVNATA